MSVSILHRRYSCRRFTGEPLTSTELDHLLEAATWAPSAGNLQPWRFVVAATAERRQQLAGAAPGQGFIATAPIVVVVCAVPAESARVYRDRGVSLYCIQDTAAAAENLLLAATEIGLGGCWVGAFDEAAASAVLELPDGWRPVVMVPVGHPAEPAGRRTRRALSEVVVMR